MDKLIYYLICVYLMASSILPYNLKVKNIPINADLILVGIILCYLIKIAISRKEFINNVIDFFHDYMMLAMMCLLGVMFISILYATEKKLALGEGLRFCTYIVMYFIIKYDINNKHKKNIFMIYIVTLFINGILGIAQKITGHGLEHKFFVGTQERIAGTFGNPNSFAAFLIIGIFPVIMLILYTKKIKAKVFYSFLFMIMIFNIYLTQSRNSWIAFAMGCVILAIIYSFKILFALGGLGAVIMLIPKGRSRIMDIGNSSLNESRIKLWKTALKMIKDHPITGVGNGNYVSLYDGYVNKYPELKYADLTRFPCHNSYLKIQSELGVLGSIPFLAVLILSLLKIKKVVEKSTDKFYKSFYTGFLISMIVFFFMNFSDNLFFVPKVVTCFWIFLALGDSILKDKSIY